MRRQTSPKNSKIISFTQIRKRNGKLVPFDACRIKTAILKAGHATGEFGDDLARSHTSRVLTVAQMALG
jgi:ribonucleoside-triphosphate reductase